MATVTALCCRRWRSRWLRYPCWSGRQIPRDRDARVQLCSVASASPRGAALALPEGGRHPVSPGQGPCRRRRARLSPFAAAAAAVISAGSRARRRPSRRRPRRRRGWQRRRRLGGSVGGAPCGPAGPRHQVHRLHDTLTVDPDRQRTAKLSLQICYTCVSRSILFRTSL